MPVQPDLVTRYTPYVPVWLDSDLAAEMRNTGLRVFRLGFVISNNGAPQAAWDGSMPLGSIGANAIKANARSIQYQGGNVVVSFGGSGGVDLSRSCPDGASMAAQVDAVIKNINPAGIDFDVEGASTGDVTVNARRADALKRVQTAYPFLPLGLTLECATYGLTERQLAVLRPVLSAGVRLSWVNAMTMYMGGDPNNMGNLVVGAGNAVANQLRSLISGLTDTAAHQMVTVTPVLGVNEYSGERFTVQNAQTVRAWAGSTGAKMSAWHELRDRAGANGLAVADYAFAAAMR